MSVGLRHRPAKLGWVKPGRFKHKTRWIYAQDKNIRENGLKNNNFNYQIAQT